MSRPASRPGLVVSVSALTALAVAAPASAQVDVHRDARHDVVQADEGETQTGRPLVESIDATRETVAYRPRALVVRTHFTDLGVPGPRRFEYVRVRTSARRGFTIGIDYARRTPDGRLLLTTRRGQEVVCSGADHTTSADDDLLRVRVPSSCLGSPHWVRVGHGSVLHPRGQVLVDDVRMDHAFDQGDVRLGPRLRRG